MEMQGFPRRFGKYVLVKPLARGGMGALYLALHGQPGMEKVCVVKTALPHLADRGYLARFRDEAKVVVRLSHGNLVTVFDAGEVKGELFLAMEFVEGKDLRAVWNRCAQKGTAFPIPVAVHLTKELVRGLAYAHSFEGLSLVHRDVSPPNLLLSYTGEVRLTDFGLATSTLKLEKTGPGVIYGKVSYMSPEQARGEVLDRRTDLYAAGVILWELLTGRQLFPSGGRGPGAVDGAEDDLLERVRRPQVVPPSQRASRVPAELDAICAKALAPEPAARYQVGEELRADLASYLARTAPATDGHQLARFLRGLFGEDIAKERSEQDRVLDEARTLLGKPDLTPRPVMGLAKPPTTGPATLAAPPPGARSGEDPTTQRLRDEHSQLTGTVLSGRYHIKRLCGEGGMGRVYEAEHVEIGKRVAVKVLHPAYTRTPDVVERFRREARAASKIYHPNIVNVTDSGTTGDGSFFFVMEYIEGVELGFVIHRDGPLAPIRVLHVAEQVCNALQAAHDVGVIHRDLKPENILLVTPAGSPSSPGMPVADGVGGTSQAPPSDVVKVLDFGIAKSVDFEEGSEVGRRLTRPGVAMGTPEYMAPEQAAGKPADARSDIYAVGSIMYEMLLAAPPYDGDNVMEVLHRKANELPRPLGPLRPELPAAVVALVERAMARSPDARPQTMRQFAEEIRQVAARLAVSAADARGRADRSGGPILAGPVDVAVAPPALRFSRRTVAAASAVLALLGGFLIVRAAMVSRARGLPAAAALARPPAPEPRPAAALAVPVRPEPFPLVGPPLDPAAPTATLTLAPQAPGPRGAAAPRPGRMVAAAPGLSAGSARELLKAGQILLRAQRYNEAADTFRRLLSARRERGMALVGLGNIAFQQKSYGDALGRGKQAVKAGGGLDAQLLLGDAYFKLEKYAESKKAYDQALRLDPRNDTARRGLELASRRLN
jgi:eukaryotic-like serine/threonine-protein kinase